MIIKKTTYNLLALAIFSIAACLTPVALVSAKDTPPSASICLKGGGLEPEYSPIMIGGGEETGVGYGEADISWIIHPTFELAAEVGYANYMIPVDVAARYRFNYYDDQVLVPFIGGGFDFYYLRDEMAFAEVDRDEDKWKYGYHGVGGIQILLDYFGSKQARDMKSKWKIENTYLNVEAKYSVVDNFGADDLDLGGVIYTAGLRFEF